MLYISSLHKKNVSIIKAITIKDVIRGIKLFRIHLIIVLIVCLKANGIVISCVNHHWSENNYNKISAP